MASFNVHPHPEWRRLLDNLGHDLEGGEFGRLYSYAELNEAAGVDIQANRGRRQFHRFQREALERYSVHFENVRNEGYETVEPSKQGQCAVKRVRKAGRQMKNAKRIGTHLQYDKLTANQITMHTDLMARIALLNETLKQALTPLRKIAAAVQTGVLPHPLRINGPVADHNDTPEGEKPLM